LMSFLGFLAIPGQNASAHSSCSTYGESYGYWIDCKNHSGNAFIQYNLGPMSSTYTNYVTGGETKWNNTGVVAINKAPAYSPNFIHTYSDKNSSANASFYDYTSNSSGHLTKWSIRMNTANMDGRTPELNKTTLAHEFGHVIGLNDLTQSKNSVYLMYGYATRSVTGPTSTDITGANKALGN
ncbi:MAG: hypothetical protein KBT36_06530, partial [Kurthia sp.]|nr:hypothetical protein [Candidatus Kurthia equi]